MDEKPADLLKKNQQQHNLEDEQILSKPNVIFDHVLPDLNLISLEEATTDNTSAIDLDSNVVTHSLHSEESESEGNTKDNCFQCFEEELSLSKDLVHESIQWVKKLDIEKAKNKHIHKSLKAFNDEEEKENNFNGFQILDKGEEKKINIVSEDLVSEDFEETFPDQGIDHNCNDCIELNFPDLPEEIKLKIFSYFSKRELCSYVAPVCLQWFQIAKDPLFWTIIYKTDFEAVDSWLLIEVILSWCKHLSFLELDSRTDITIEGYEMIFKSCPMIKHLSLKLCRQIDNDTLKLLSKHLKHLESIDLEGCINISDKSFYHFIGLPLNSFSLAYCNQVSDEGGIFLIRNFKNLTKVNFDGIQWITEEVVQELVNHHKDTLEEVSLDGENIDDKSIELLSTCNNLRLLEISFCNSLTYKTIEMLTNCGKITDLKLRKGADFTNQSILRFFDKMSKQQGLGFKSLNLAECTEITDECLLNISERCPNLERLNLSWCWEVSDDGISFIIDNCHRLKELHLVGLHELYGTPFFRIIRNNPDLRYLDLSQCNKVDDDILKSLLQNLPKLTVKNYYGDTMVMESYDIFESDSE